MVHRVTLYIISCVCARSLFVYQLRSDPKTNLYVIMTISTVHILGQERIPQFLLVVILTRILLIG
jgi:hypothetical protein